MGMFGEIHASINAKWIEDLLRIAIDSGNRDVILFAKANLLPRYILECEEAWQKSDENLVRSLEGFKE